MSVALNSLSIFKRDAFLFVMQLITGVVVARKLGPEMMGTFVILTMILTYAESFGRIKFDYAAVYFLGKKEHSLPDVVFTLNMLALISSFAIVGLFLWQFHWFYDMLFSKNSFDARAMVYFILLQIPLNFLCMNYKYLLIHRNNIKALNKMIIIKSMVSSIPAIFLITVLDYGLWSVVITSVISILCGLIYGIFKLGPCGRVSRLVNLPLIKDLLIYGFKLYIAGLVGHFQAYASNLVVVLYLIPAQVAFYSMARSVGQFIDKIPAALNTILFPHITKMDTIKESAQTTAKAFRVLFVLLTCAGFGSFVMIKPFVYTLYGMEFLPIVKPFIILIPGIVLAGVTTPFVQFFNSINRADLQIKLSLFPMVLQIVFLLILTPEFELAGAAISFTLSLVAYTFIITYMFLKLSSCSIRRDLAVSKADLKYLYDLTAMQISKAVKSVMLKS